MEAAQLSPPDGERPCDPRSLEAGDTEPIGGNEATCHDNGRTQRREDNEGARDSRIWNDETSRARDAEGPRNPSACTDEGSCATRSEGPRDPRARTGEGNGDSGTDGDAGARIIEGPGTWRDETARASRSGYSKRTDASPSEGPRARTDETAVTTSSEGPRTDETAVTTSSEGPRARTDETAVTTSSEGPRAGIDETALAISSEGPRARTDETAVAIFEGPRAWTDETAVAISSEGPRSDEISLTPRFSKGALTISSEGPRSDETSFAPGFSKGATSSEGPRARTDEIFLTPGFPKGTVTVSSKRLRSDETTLGSRSGFSKGANTTSSQGPRNPGAITGSNEEPGSPRDGAHAVPYAARENSSNQRLTGPEGTYAARTCNEGPNDVRPTESEDAGTKDATKQPHSESNKGGNGSGGSTLEGSSEGTESFKKPIGPFRSSWNEKTLDQHDQPSSSTLSSISSRETTTDDRSRLPSDAYRANPAIPYREPSWSGRPQTLYCLELLKGGSILSTKSLNDSSWTIFGRLPTCHVSLEHPSVSRYHAVLQYRSVPGTEPDQEPGFYVYDLGSTHGTFVNKQRIQSKTYCRIRVGHVLKFGGSTRLFILQGPDEDQEAESELTVTQIKEVRRQKESLQKRMLGDDSDEEDNTEEKEVTEQKERGGSEEAGCTWGMGEDAVEEENDVNPIAMEYQAEREALYSGNPKKALQGFFDREGEELEFEYEARGVGSWLCSVKLPADDSSGKQLVAEVVHSGKKKEAMRLCALEACRMLDMRGLLRQEAVSRKRKAKQWEAEDFYDSDDDTFLDRTGVVEKKRLNRMKKAGKIDEKPETYESLTVKLDLVEKEIEEIATKLKTNRQDEAQASSQDSLDAFMTEIKAGSSVDGVTRRKLHLQSLELKKEQQRLKTLIKIVQPTRLPELKAGAASQDPKTKKLTLPMFGAMKGGSKFKLKTGTVGRLPPKRSDLPPSLFTMKGDDEPEEEEEEEDNSMETASDSMETASDSRAESRPVQSDTMEPIPENSVCPARVTDVEEKIQSEEPKKRSEPPSASPRTPKSRSPPATKTEDEEEETTGPKASAARQKRVLGPSRPPPGALSSTYPEDDPDYCVWTPPTGQTGDGRTHLNEKYGY
ncbi:kanadaptin isoform 2-T2 [Anomaloglossus baeobatrachus]|uniref:kanadaptin isoform X2 n=1 Tax=Anomaloglossus baeobatrachus TaxID=238106 RepID=UPI003F4FBEF9